jgi:hypothetical protein
MHKHTTEVTFITEIWLQAQRELPVYGYRTERIDRGNGYEGTAVYMKQEMYLSIHGSTALCWTLATFSVS